MIKQENMAYFINLNEDKTQVVVSQEWTEGCTEIGPDGYAIATVSGDVAGCYGAADDAELIALANNSFAAEVTTATEAVTFFNANVGPVFYQGVPA
jgi:hypothetical protein